MATHSGSCNVELVGELFNNVHGYRDITVLNRNIDLEYQALDIRIDAVDSL